MGTATDHNGRNGKPGAAAAPPVDEFYSGLEATVYDLWFPPDRAQVDEAFFRKHIKANGGAALEIGCGTGRLLLKFLVEGLPVEGLDRAAEMLSVCRERARSLGVDPVLHEASMESFSLNKRYRTLFIPFFSFMMLVDRRDAMRALERFHAHLEPGGRLYITAWTPRADALARREWQLLRHGVQPNTGHTVLCHAASELNWTEQTEHDWFRYEVFDNGRLVETSLREMSIRWYHRHEMELMLLAAGFGDVRIWGDESEEPLNDRHTSMMAVATRPS